MESRSSTRKVPPAQGGGALRRFLQFLGHPVVGAAVEIVLIVGQIIGAILIDEYTDAEDDDD